jgi:hypothetical protein
MKMKKGEKKLVNDYRIVGLDNYINYLYMYYMFEFV